ncbi:hypothetical protein GB937_007349 [Aspergillus fischeri]|nr:hypothetical protein GB937_007349 [Aspergillus fischeri]
MVFIPMSLFNLLSSMSPMWSQSLPLLCSLPHSSYFMRHMGLFYCKGNVLKCHVLYHFAAQELDLTILFAGHAAYHLDTKPVSGLSQQHLIPDGVYIPRRLDDNIS